VRRVLAPVVLLLALCVAPPAVAQVVTLRAFPGAQLSQGPQLVGERVAWSQELCVRGCETDFASEVAEVYEVRSAGADGRVRRVFRARTSGAFSGPNFGFDFYSFLHSEQVLATLRHRLSGDEFDVESGGVSLRAGAPGGGRELLAQCDLAPSFDARTPVAVNGNGVVFDPEPCDGVSRFVLRDFATGATQPLPAPADAVSEVRLRGRFAAWVESDGMAARLVVHDLTAGTPAYSAAVSGVADFDLDADGSVALVTGDPRRPCRTGRLLRSSVAAPAPADLGPACATGVRIEAGRIVFLGWEGFTRTLRAVGPDGGAEDLVRFGRVRPGDFDLDGERIAWAARDCGGGQAIFSARLAEAPLEAGSINCRVRFASGTVRVRRGLATVRLTCPRGCGGELILRHMGRRDFSLLRGEREVRVRLSRRARDRVERRGSVQALAKIVTRNRAGDRQARSRAVTLVAR
jgi:hypothetical protein